MVLVLQAISDIPRPWNFSSDCKFNFPQRPRLRWGEVTLRDLFLLARESFYGNPANFFSNEIGGFETSFRSYLLKNGALAPPTSSFDRPLQTRKNVKVVFFMASFLVSSSHDSFETFSLRKIAGVWAGYRRISHGVTSDPPILVRPQLWCCLKFAMCTSAMNSMATL